MKAYKIWHDTRYFIHKNNITDYSVMWTTNIEDAKDVPTFSGAVKFFSDKLGFNIYSGYDRLHLL
ncbi:hypothetical protein M0P65_07425 [Candidatus Gracilibacteria bacterium]|nr:hypothetical protein [Candidatus Gracilibacteria bacterium]